MAAPSPVKQDLQARLWTEVANARRVASEWSKATAALLQAGKHLAQGSGDPLLKARAQSISAFLSADQGRRVEALATLEECVQLCESQGAWALVARTMVHMAHTLVDTDPARALILAVEHRHRERAGRKAQFRKENRDGGAIVRRGEGEDRVVLRIARGARRGGALTP